MRLLLLLLVLVQQANPSGRPTLSPVNTDEMISPAINAGAHNHLFVYGIKSGVTVFCIFPCFLMVFTVFISILDSFYRRSIYILEHVVYLCLIESYVFLIYN